MLRASALSGAGCPMTKSVETDVWMWGKLASTFAQLSHVASRLSVPRPGGVVITCKQNKECASSFTLDAEEGQGARGTLRRLTYADENTRIHGDMDLGSVVGGQYRRGQYRRKLSA